MITLGPTFPVMSKVLGRGHIREIFSNHIEAKIIGAWLTLEASELIIFFLICISGFLYDFPNPLQTLVLIATLHVVAFLFERAYVLPDFDHKIEVLLRRKPKQAGPNGFVRANPLGASDNETKAMDRRSSKLHSLLVNAAKDHKGREECLRVQDRKEVDLAWRERNTQIGAELEGGSDDNDVKKARP